MNGERSDGRLAEATGRADFASLATAAPRRGRRNIRPSSAPTSAPSKPKATGRKSNGPASTARRLQNAEATDALAEAHRTLRVKSGGKEAAAPVQPELLMARPQDDAHLFEKFRTLLQEALALHDLIAQQMKAQEKRVAAEFKLDSSYERLLSLPGVGPTLGAVLAAEIDQIERFPSADKLCGYAGVVPTTHNSRGKAHHGRLLPFCNKWIRWALIEASWVTIGCSPYFGSLYRQQRARGKKPTPPLPSSPGACAVSSISS